MSTVVRTGNLSMRVKLKPSEERVKEKIDFMRCKNLEDVPESLCPFCMHTMIAPTITLLEGLEISHHCRGTILPEARRRQLITLAV